MASLKVKAKSEGNIEKRPEVPRGASVIAGTGIKVPDVAIRYEIPGMMCPYRCACMM